MASPVPPSLLSPETCGSCTLPRMPVAFPAEEDAAALLGSSMTLVLEADMMMFFGETEN